MRVSTSLALILALLTTLSACGGPAAEPATNGIVTISDPTPTKARPPSDLTAILRIYGPRSQRDHDLDWSTLTGIDSYVSDGSAVHLALGTSASGQEHLLLAVIVPETGTEDWRPQSAGVHPIGTDGPAFLTRTAPDGRDYHGFIGADPREVIEYEGQDGTIQSVEVNSSQGVMFLHEARKSDPRPWLRQEASP